MVLDKHFEEILGRVALRVYKEVIKNTPVRTGRLRNSINIEKHGDSYTIGTNLKYAEPVEIGMKPTVIKPKNKKALYWPGARHPVKQVNHPGFDGRNMFLKASKQVDKILAEELKKIN